MGKLPPLQVALDQNITNCLDVPEKQVLLAMLHRALRDLYVAELNIRQSAVNWFEGNIEVRRDAVPKFTFDDCAMHLELGSKQLAFIKIRVQEAKESYGKSNTERKESRKRDSELSKILRSVRYSEENTAVFRDGRNIRRYLRRA